MNTTRDATMDDLDNLGDCLKTMSVRSKSSARRMAFRVNRPSAHSFYSTAPAAINYTAGVDDEDDEDDSTYEASTETESNSVPSDHSSQEMPVAEQREEMEFCDTFPSSINSTIANDDASDYLGSDDGLGPNDEEVQRDARGYQKYFERASSLIQNPNYPCYFGLPADTVYWVVKLSRFNSDERRWVNKGPVILYFNFNEHPRLMANYLYSTKSTCLDLQLFEHFNLFVKHNTNKNYCQFSTFRQNAVKHAEIIPEKVPLSEFFPQADLAHGLPVIKCINVVKSVQEERAKTFTVHFVTQRDHYKFEEYLNFVMERVSLNALETRNRSFLLNPSRHANGQNITHKCTYLGCPDFVTQVFHLNKLVHNGFRYYPLLASSGHIVDKVQCTWCGLQLGPFNDIVDIRPLHFQGNSELQLIACPFTAQ